jgi:inward rectifier potassium channel
MHTEVNHVMPQHAAKEPSAAQGRFARTRKIRMGSAEVLTHGLPAAYLQDVYHYAMTLSWWWFMGICAAAFLLLNTVFAGLYLVFDDSIANQFPSGFLGAFFFSVETLATVGYGDMHPATLYAHWVATGEIFLGMASVALITGVMFARFSRPKARILFAEHPVVTTMDGRQTLMIRLANARQNMIVDASAKLRLIRTEQTAEGTQFRRIYDLRLRRDEQPLFILGWSLMHDIEADGPLQDLQQADAQSDAILVLSIGGVDETTGQTMLSRFTYAHGKIRWGHRFVDLLHTDAQGNSHMDYARIHLTEAEAGA